MTANPLLYLLILLFFALNISAQELTLKLSQHPNKKAVIVAVHGIRKDTLGTVQLDQNGKGKLAFKNKQSQAGLVNLTIKDMAYLSYDFVLSPNENPTFICDMEYVYTQNTKILHSPENVCLNRWFGALEQYKQRIGLNQELSKLYQPEEAFLTKLAEEKQTTQEKLQKLTDTINQSPLFAGKYMQFKLAQEEQLTKVWESKEQRALAKNYFATQIDFDALYGSSMWFSIINACIEAYTKESPYYETFGTDVVANLKRIKNQQVYEDLIEAAISVTEKFSWNKDQEAIVDFIVKDNRIKNPQGKLQKIIQLHQLSIGKKAPDLIIKNTNGTTTIKTAELQSKNTLLLFYKSGCGPCETTIEGLKTNYATLLAKGVKIIALSADIDKAEFQKTASTFPWKNTYCDLAGMNGENFRNYAVIGTPTMYLLDSKGLILKKLATVEELVAWSKKE